MVQFAVSEDLNQVVSDDAGEQDESTDVLLRDGLESEEFRRLALSDEENLA